MATMNISLTDEMKAFIEDQVLKGGFSTVSEYMRGLVREAQERQALREKVDAVLMVGLDSGPATAMTSRDWDSIRQEVHERQKARRETVDGSKDRASAKAAPGDSRPR
jgi:antitoxin ParD1/3/4